MGLRNKTFRCRGLVPVDSDETGCCKFAARAT